MSGFIEQLCVGMGGAPQVLKRIPWTGSSLGRDQFREIAFTILSDERRAALAKSDAGATAESPPGCEAVRFIRDDGSEAYRYDLSDLENDIRTEPSTNKA